MDSQVLVSFAVVILAVSGFIVLVRTLQSVWRQKGSMTGSTKTSDAGSLSEGGTQWEWENNECYRKCMDRPFSGTGNQYRHCAAECGLR